VPDRPDITREDYLAAFSTVPGRKVLGHILYEGHVFEECLTDEEVHERNFAVRLLRNLGAIRPDNIPLMAEALIRAAALPPRQDRNEGEDS